MKVEILIDENACKACGYCIEACPKKILAFAEHYNNGGYHPASVSDKSKCIGCASCYQVCPEIAIKVSRE
jgi:2-oxoglutarate ferredoxin oxidoreductase subunit delta